MASRFEIEEKILSNLPQNPQQYPQYSKGDNTIQTGVLSLKKRSDNEILDISEQQLIQDEIKEVEMINAVMQKTLNSGNVIDLSDDIISKRQLLIQQQQQKLNKKKSVSFCDQVILVATAEEQEDDSYIPNPILERVLRSAVHKSEANAIRQEISHLRDGDKIEECPKSPQNVLSRSQNQLTYQSAHDADVVDGVAPPISLQENSGLPPQIATNLPAQTYQQVPQQPYIRQNSVDSLLSRSNSTLSQNSQVYGTSPQYRTNYQPLPPNAQVTRIYPPQPQNTNPEYAYSTSVRTNNNAYPNQAQVIRQSPLPMQPVNQQQYGVYQHPPISNTYNNRPVNAQQYSPAAYQQRVPNVSSSSNEYGMYCQGQVQVRPSVEQGEQQNQMYQQNGGYVHAQHYNAYQTQQISPQYQRVPQNGYSYQELQENGTVYQRVVGPQQDYNVPYQRLPQNHQMAINNEINSSTYPRIPNQNQQLSPQLNGYHPQMDNTMSVSQQQQQRTTSSSNCQTPEISHINSRQSPYLPALIPKQILKKSVSFEPGTKGGAESPVPKAVVTPIIINTNINNNNKIKCNLCRKKTAQLCQGQNLYCTDCEFYMSRFKPK